MKTLKKIYTERFNKVLVPLAQELESEIREYLIEENRIDKVTARPKSIESFLLKSKKTENCVIKYNDPINQIQDQIGARIVTYYLEDVERISKLILTYYRPIENKSIVPDSDTEFGYFGTHFILLFPPELIPEIDETSLILNVFELQINTMFQHAWAEASHDLVYKPDKPITKDQKRKVAFTAAQAWGADLIFEELQKQLN